MLDLVTQFNLLKLWFHRTCLHPLWHTGPALAKHVTQPVLQRGCFLQQELKCKCMLAREEPDLGSIQNNTTILLSLFLIIMDCFFKRLHVARNLPKIAFNEQLSVTHSGPDFLFLLLSSLLIKGFWNPFLIRDRWHSLSLGSYLLTPRGFRGYRLLLRN